MASTRYGRIYHSDHHYNNMKFRSAAAREKFAEAFEQYHDSHDHDGDVPRFEIVKASDIKGYERGAQEFEKVTIDEYTWAEIKKYHNRENPEINTHYHVPTCCVSPLIVLDRDFIDSGTLERHDLSSVFGDIENDEFQHLLKSVESDGFMDPVIRMHEGQILDGWHRYRVGLELNLVRKLMFSNYDAEKEGSPVAFVAARNLERRHMTPGQRAQSVVYLNERFGWGGDRSKGTNVHLKTQEELAKQANVSKKTIQRAEKVEAAGESEAVITGEKSAGQVIEAETVKDLWEQVSAEMKDWKQRHKDYQIGYASKTCLINSLRTRQMSEEDGAATVEELKDLLKLMRHNSRSFVLRVKQTLTGEEPDEILPQSNPYTNEATYTDGQLINLLIHSFKQQLDDFDPSISDNAVEKLQMIRQALIIRGYNVDEKMNVERKPSDPEPETHSESSEPTLSELRDTWFRARSAMFEAFTDSDLTPEHEGEVGDDTPYQHVLDAFVAEVQRRHPNMDLYSHPNYEGTYGDPNQLKAYEREIETYPQITADIQSQAEWFLKVVESVPVQTDPEPESETPASEAKQTAVERETNKLEKQKKQALKSMWDTRIQAARDWTGDADTELNQYVSLPELEKGFQKNNPSYASAFASAMKRTSEQSYEVMVGKVLESYVELKVLQSEVRALTTYAGDIRQWQRPDWSPDTNWILPLIEKKKSAESQAKPDPELEENNFDANLPDTSLADLNLPVLKGFLDTLLDTVGHVEHQITREDLSVTIYEVFDQFKDITEREQLSILIDCAHSIVTETETHA